MNQPGRWRTVDVIITLLAGAGLAGLLSGPAFLAHTALEFSSSDPIAADPSASWSLIGEAVPARPDTYIWFATGFLWLASVSATFAHQAMSRGRRRVIVLFHCGAIVSALAFVGAQLSRPVRFGTVDMSPLSSQFFIFAGEHAMSLIFGMALLGVSAIVALTRGTGEVSPASEAAIWHWHAVDSAWLSLMVFGFSHNLLKGL